MNPVCNDKTVFERHKNCFIDAFCSRIIMTRVGSLPKNAQPGCEAHLASHSKDTGVLFRQQSGRGVKLPTHLHPVPRLGMTAF